MTMTYIPSWEKSSNRWDTEPEIWEDLYLEEEESESDEISIDLVDESELSIEFEETYDLEQIYHFTSAIIFVDSRLLFNSLRNKITT